MSKPLIGVILGAVLGLIDGLTAWFTPDARNELGSNRHWFHDQRNNCGNRDRILCEEVSLAADRVLFGVWWAPFWRICGV